MRWRTLATALAIVLGWTAFASWQYSGYCRDRELIEESLHQQAHSIANTLIGGIRSHRRLRSYFDAQIQMTIEELVQSEDVLAAAVVSGDGKLTASAGEVHRLNISPTTAAGNVWDSTGFRFTERFRLAPLVEAVERDSGRGAGRGGGRGGGFGSGRGPWWRDDANLQQSVFTAGGDFVATLLLDDARAKALLRGAAWSHALVAAAGALVLLFIAMAWHASVRLATVRVRAQVLETETRHLRELSQAAAGLAHETRNPLGLVRGWTQRLAQMEADDPQRQEYIQAVIEECDRVTARINQFLAFARPHHPAMEVVDLEELTAELATILQPDLDAKKLRLDRQSDEPRRQVRADRELLRQALFNMLQNAVQFSPEGEAIALTVASGQDGTCRIEVGDRGPGVAEANRRLLFTPYFTTRSGGTGLGLAMVRQIATLHGWEARYQARPGGGALFVLEGIHV